MLTLRLGVIHAMGDDTTLPSRGLCLSNNRRHPIFAEFEHGDYEGITYLDTFFVKRRSAAAERLHFHELIHVVQWRLLGPETFLAAYAAGLETFGYRESPLEIMAYNAEASFCQSDQLFDAENLVAEQLSRMRGIHSSP
jgi:hypothetical protein